jgi:tRNA G18 (ribose-2'-O)-methylase SpoU
VAEGAFLVRRLLTQSRFQTCSVLATPAALGNLADAFAAAPATLAVYVACPALLSEIVGFKFHRGCLALGERGRDLDLSALVTPAGPRMLLVLDGLADPDNVGGVFRSAAAFGVDGVLLSEGTADPLYRKALRVSMGAALTLPFARLEPGAVGAGRLRAAGYSVIVLAPDGATDIMDVGTSTAAPQRLALVVGGEGAGVSPALRAASDASVRITMAPGVDSLNVGVAAGIALHRLGPARHARASSAHPSR